MNVEAFGVQGNLMLGITLSKVFVDRYCSLGFREERRRMFLRDICNIPGVEKRVPHVEIHNSDR